MEKKKKNDECIIDFFRFFFLNVPTSFYSSEEKSLKISISNLWKIENWTWDKKKKTKNKIFTELYIPILMKQYSCKNWKLYKNYLCISICSFNQIKFGKFISFSQNMYKFSSNTSRPAVKFNERKKRRYQLKKNEKKKSLFDAFKQLKNKSS